MVEPLFKKAFTAAPVVGQTITLDGDEGKHAASVRRLRVGEAVVLCDGLGTKAHGSVAALASKSIDVLVERVEVVAEPKLRVRLIQALAKGDRDELAIQAATELGAYAVTPWQAERSISRWDAAKAAKGQERWQVICDEAGKQALRAWFAKVEALTTSEQLVSAIAAGSLGQVLVLDPTAKVGLSSALSVQNLAAEVSIVVGPEGGISETELVEFEKAGATRVHLGNDILRTSTAGVAAIAVINSSLGVYR